MSRELDFVKLKEGLYMKKRCTLCLKEKDICCFGKQKYGKFGRRGRCNACRRKIEIESAEDKNRKTKWYKNNRALCLRRARANYEENRENKLIYQTKYAMKNKKRIAEYMKNYNIKNRDTIIEYRKRWCKENIQRKIDSNRECDRRRRARKANVGENYTKLDQGITYGVFGKKCFKCGSKEKLAIDHHRPLSKGFSLTIVNAVILCKSCNSTKHVKDPVDFYSDIEILKIKKLFRLAQKIKKGAVDND